MKRGEVRWFKFKPPDKKRPMLILTRSSAIEYLVEVTVAPITSTIRNIPSEVPLSRADGMHKACAVNLDHVQTVSKSKIGDLICELTPARLLQIRHALSFALDLSTRTS